LNRLAWLGRELKIELKKASKFRGTKGVATGEGQVTGRSRKFQVSSLPFYFPNACHCNFIDLSRLCVKFHESDIQR